MLSKRQVRLVFFSFFCSDESLSLIKEIQFASSSSSSSLSLSSSSSSTATAPHCSTLVTCASPSHAARVASIWSSSSRARSRSADESWTLHHRDTVRLVVIVLITVLIIVLVVHCHSVAQQYFDARDTPSHAARVASSPCGAREN